MMRIKSLETMGFGSLGDRRISFGSGLTVIRGPNEAGKSFTIRAICQGLFGDAATTDRKIRDYCRKWNSEGDFSVRLELEDDGKTYLVTRDYEERKNVLQAEGGKEIRDKKKIAERIGGLLGLPTEKAFLATACIMQEEVEALGEEKASIRSIMEEKIAGSGSDADKILKKLSKKMEELRSKSGRKGKLIELQAEIEALQEELREARERLGQLVNNKRELVGVKGELEAGRNILADKQRALENSRKYIEAQEEMKRRDREFEQARKNLDECREAKRKIGESEKSLAELGGKLERLVEEIDKAERYLKADHSWSSLNGEYGRLKEKLERLRGLEIRISELQKDLEGMSAIDPAELRNAMSLPGEISSLESVLQEQLFGVEVRAETGVAFAITADGRSVEGSRAEAHREALVEFPGIASVHLTNLSGGESPLVEEISRKQEALKRVLDKYGAPDLEALEELDRRYRERKSELEGLQKEKATLLGDDTLEELEAALRELQSELERAKEERESLTRYALPEEELRKKREEKEALEKEKRELERTISECRGTLKVVGEDDVELQERVDACAKELALARANLNELAPYKCSAEEFSRLEREVEELQERVKDLEHEEIRLQERINSEKIGEEDVVAVEERLGLAKLKKERLQRRYDVRRLIAENIEWARERAISGFSRAIEERMGVILSSITGGKYGRVEVDGNLGVRIYSEEKGGFLDLENRDDLSALSSGTLDQVYLAARLAVLEIVAGDRKPPLILDDTFVSFDDMGRKRNAFELLKKLAEEWQVLYFTCHDCPPELEVVEI